MTSHSGPTGVVVRIALPRADDPADIRLDVVGRFLHIEVEHERGGATERVHQRVTLPPGTTEDDLVVSCAGGVLEVRAPVGPRSSQ